jgi:hypothetical protein
MTYLIHGENFCKCHNVLLPSTTIKNKMKKKRILPYSWKNGYPQEHKQQQVLMRMWGKKEPLYTAGRNVN